jgi:hypothetical protein
MAKNDAYWDALGVAWRAIEPASAAIVPRLKARLRWQTMCSVGIMIVGTQLGAVGAILGAVTIYLGGMAFRNSRRWDHRDVVPAVLGCMGAADRQ